MKPSQFAVLSHQADEKPIEVEEFDIEATTGRRMEGRIMDSRFVSDAVLGLSDGMTVPFALTAGLSELGDTRVVVLAGLAELCAGAISMGLGGYLGAKSEEDIKDKKIATTRRETRYSSQPMLSMRIVSVFARYEVPPDLLSDFASFIARSPFAPEFLLQFEHGIDDSAGSRAISCALTIAAGYFMGGFIPLAPYLLVHDRGDVHSALVASVLTMIVALFLLGFTKSFVSLSLSFQRHGDLLKAVKGGFEMLFVGGLSAGCAVVLVKAFNSLI